MPLEKILVVDDEAANLQKLKRTFVNRYPVLAAGSGREALELLRDAGDVAVIIADQRMPDMSGIEFLRRTLEALPDAVRIILTGYMDADVLMEAINSCRVFRYLVKPWDPPDLLMTVERGLEAHRLSVENARFRKELIRRERMARELEIAREIQRYILPPACLQPEGYETAVKYHPAREVGGDLYDFDWNWPAGILRAVIGDVSGKSIPAALYGAVFSGYLRSIFEQMRSPRETLRALNAGMIARYEASNHIAVALLQLDRATGRGTIANGGMPFPIIVRNGKLLEVAVPGMPLGLLEEADFEEVDFHLEPGDLLLLTSDGVTEAMNAAGLMYETGRLRESILRHAGEKAETFVQSIYREVAGFTGQAELHDDITVLAIRRRE